MVQNILIGCFLLLTSTACLGQTQLHGLTAGQSTRADAERVLGPPVQVDSPTLVEYRPGWENGSVAKVYIQYRKDSPIIERIEVLRVRPLNRADVLRSLNLPDQPTTHATNAAGNLVEYFGPPSYAVLTYQGPDARSGVARTARYSPELFQSAVRSIASPAASASLPWAAGGVPGAAPAGAPAAASGAATTPTLGAPGPGTSPRPSLGAAATQPGDFLVRLLTPIDTRTSKKGDKVTAQVITPQQFSGDILEGSVKNVKSGNKIKGTSVLNFSFDLLNHGGQAIPVQATVKSVTNSQGKEGVDEEGQIVRKKNSFGTLALGTGLGSLVGALAGGGKGAAIGAGVGAAAALILVEVGTQGPNVSFAPGSQFVVNLKRRS